MILRVGVTEKKFMLRELNMFYAEIPFWRQFGQRLRVR